MALTPELVARIARSTDDPGYPAGVVPLGDADYDRIVDGVLAAHPVGEDVWLFAYGSLLWRPECPIDEERVGHLPGWHRTFCFRVVRFRGAPDNPGLMMALDRGGSCRGMLQRIPWSHVRERLEKLMRRELRVLNSPNRPCWLTATSEGGRMRALVFTINRASPLYVGPRPLEETAEVLARAAGHAGSGAEYLMNTVRHLEELGIRDRNLWRLQAMVAERIEALRPA